MALPPSLRFPNRSRVGKVLRRGRRLATPLGRVFIRPAEDSRGRILFVVPKAVSRKSTERNRLKRQLDELARTWRGGALHRHDLVVFVAPALAALPRSLRSRRAAETFTKLSTVFSKHSV